MNRANAPDQLNQPPEGPPMNAAVRTRYALAAIAITAGAGIVAVGASNLLHSNASPAPAPAPAATSPAHSETPRPAATPAQPPSLSDQLAANLGYPNLPAACAGGVQWTCRIADVADGSMAGLPGSYLDVTMTEEGWRGTGRHDDTAAAIVAATPLDGPSCVIVLSPPSGPYGQQLEGGRACTQ